MREFTKLEFCTNTAKSFQLIFFPLLEAWSFTVQFFVKYAQLNIIRFNALLVLQCHSLLACLADRLLWKFACFGCATQIYRFLFRSFVGLTFCWFFRTDKSDVYV